MNLLGAASWAVGVAALLGFAGLVIAGRRGAKTRGVAKWTLVVALGLQLACVPFYTRSLVGHSGRVDVAQVICSPDRAGRIRFHVAGSYVDAAGVRHEVSDRYPPRDRDRYFGETTTNAPFGDLLSRRWAPLGNR